MSFHPSITSEHAFILLGAGLLAGALNAVAGGGSFISFPALVYCGIPPISANASNALATWPGLVGASWGYRHRLRPYLRLILVLSTVSIMGGAVGGVLIVFTPSRIFAKIVPFLLLLGTLLLLIRFRRRSAKRDSLVPVDELDGKVPTSLLDPRSLSQFAVALYGGYFVGGAGLMQMAVLSMFGIEDVQIINGLKNVFGVLMSGAALVALIAGGKIAWLPACALTVGSTLGGVVGGRMAQRLNQTLLQGVIVVFGVGITAYFFYKYY
jgi:uncharacterized membrane protein YfcA